MAKSSNPLAQLVYPVVGAFVERCLNRSDSLFTPGEAVWSDETLDDFQHRFVDQPDGSKDSFEQKFERQLAGASAGTIQLAAEILCVYFLVPERVKLKTKVGQIERVLAWGAPIAELPKEFREALAGGMVESGGVAYATKKPFQLQFILALARRLRQEEDRAALISDPWRFRELLHSIHVSTSRPMREALLHLVHPDTFECITSWGAKQKITEGFADRVATAGANVDQKLWEIRQALEENTDREVHFYLQPWRDSWAAEASRWGQFVHWARRFRARADFEVEERDYKFEIAGKMRRARELFEHGDEGWREALKSAFGGGNNLTNYRTHGSFLDWLKENPKSEAALRAIWAEEGGPEERIRNFSSHFPHEVVAGRGLRTNLASVLHMVHDLERWPPYKWTPFQRAFQLTDSLKPGSKTEVDEAALYRHALDFLDLFSERAAERGLELSDRLDLQGALWCVTNWDPRDWPKKERVALEEWRQSGGSVVIEPIDKNGSRDEVDPPTPLQTLAELAENLYLDSAFLERIDRLLRAKRQVIFYGPPGTGKTYVARKLANHLAEEDSAAVELVQFHPSYAYEDFVEGYRPVRDGTGFAIRPGPLKRIANRAQENPERDHFLIIDEINRGNLAKLFGELFFLLEYREAEITLQYSEAKFALPRNLYVIGTMNTADRSIAVIDAALRRRFHFVGFKPEEEPIGSLLSKWLAAQGSKLSWVAEVVALANRKLDEPDLAIGPSHFMVERLDEAMVRDIWRHSILPYLADHFFDAPGRLREFDLGLLRDELEGDRGSEIDADS